MSLPRLSRALTLTILLFSSPALSQPPARAEPSKEQLERWLKQYPAADANSDGVLSRAEAEAYRQRLQQQRRREGQSSNNGFRTEFTFATMSDGVKIALAVGYPEGFDASDNNTKWPAVMEMHGYPGSTVPQPPGDFGNHYVTVRASLRGAGASGGTIHAISRRNGMDGYEVIENWIVKQPWSNGKVALHGHSWGGLSGFMVAATNPPHLTAVAVSGLLDDVYRDIGRIGGVRNSGFPVEWEVNLYKPTGPFDSGQAAIEARGLTADEYAQIVAVRPPWDLQHGILWKSLVGNEYQPEFAEASPGNFATGVRAPIHIMHAYQDEQTGPSGLWLWKSIGDDVPKRLVLSNGDHGEVGRFGRERRAWLDFWTLQDGRGDASDFTDRNRRVQVYFESPRNSDALNDPYVASDFPLPATVWTRFYCRAGQSLAADPPPTQEAGSDSYGVTVGVPDDQRKGVHYLLNFEKPTALCGPIAVTLWATCTTIDTDFYVVVADADADGAVQLLQRGLLRASHRAVDKNLSTFASVEGEEILVRPRHSHQDTAPLVPGETYQFDIEVFPVGHVFRSGHKLVLWVSQPLSGDPVTRHRDERPAYRYESEMPPGRVTILRTAQHPSSIVLPLLPELPPIGDQPLNPGQQSGIYVK